MDQNWVQIAKIIIGRGKLIVGVAVYLAPALAAIIGHPMDDAHAEGWRQAAMLIGGVGIADKALTFGKWILSE